ncbi:MAG: HDIG domain-containing protein, partial [Firmicutes bacterium]|nr:HDIG domain-containing protein [Bacillota bacterium]
MLLSAAGRVLSGYFVPVALGTMLTAVLLDVRHGVFLALVLGVYVGLLTGGDLGFAAVATAGGLTGAFVSSRLGQRTELMRAGLLVAGVNVLGVAAMDAFAGQGLFELGTLRDMVWGAGAGLVSGVLTIGLLPFLEDVFGILTNLKLLELANPNQPLLRRLLMQAPGTYHHSIVVANLAEAATAEVGGNPVLARVGAYYHDIGKVVRPDFFVDNQFGGENPHDKLAPSLSALVITAHVRDGVAMAEQAGLPEPVVDLIRQHHGDYLVSYFYNRAQENGEAGSVSEANFRYEGPRPQTREAAVLMLADACEAAVRALGRASPGRIEGVVRRVIKERLDSGQLQDSPLTLQDLSRIGAIFSRLLAGTFHRRMEYPDLVREVKGRRAGGAEGRPGPGNGSKRDGGANGAKRDTAANGSKKDGAADGSKKEGAKRVG